MRNQARDWPLLGSIFLVLAFALLAPTSALGATLHPKLLAKAGYGSLPVGFARTADGALHVALESNINWGDGFNGVGAFSISPSGTVGPEVVALSWGTAGGSANGVPGLAVLPSGLQAVFGGSPSSDDGPWGISSTTGGASWLPPVDVGRGSMEAGDSNVSLAVSNGTPVFAAGCCGGIVIQRGFGTGAPTFQLTNSSDNAAGNTDLAADATGAVVAGWDSNAGSGGLWLQQVAPTVGAAQKAPVPTQYGTGTALVVAGRDSGPGVYAAYPGDFATTTHMRLLRYGGGSVAVGSVKGLLANTWGAATGSDGRIWVMWSGTINGKGVTAVTRSNRAVTRFGPVQKYDFTWSSLFTLSGDGRLGPLDMLMSGSPSVKTGPLVGGIYYARILPALAAKISVKKKGHKFALKVKVTDAGDPVAGAKVSAKGAHKVTKSTGVAKLKVHGRRGKRVTVTIKDGGFTVFKKKVKL